MNEALDQAHRIAGRAVGVVGEAGVGKSRLIYEFISSQSCRVLGSCALSYENAASWAPVIDVLHSYFDVDGTQPGEEILSRVSERMRALDSGLEGHIAPILSLLGALPTTTASVSSMRATASSAC